MTKKSWKKAAIALTAAAASYSYLPSQAGKLRNWQNRRRQQMTQEKVLYLTFDDGPHPVYTEKLLDLLQRYGIKATFFVVGAFAAEYPHLVLRMEQERHTIGLHSMTHKSAMIQTPSYTRWDFARSLEIMEDLGILTEYYRPPWGHVNWFTFGQMKANGLKKVLWDVMADDWKESSTVEKMQYTLLKDAKDGSIICLHDGRGDGPVQKEAPLRMIQTLEQTIPIWLEEGYRFAVIDEKFDNER